MIHACISVYLQILSYFVSSAGVDKAGLRATMAVSKQWRDLAGHSPSLWQNVRRAALANAADSYCISSGL